MQKDSPVGRRPTPLGTERARAEKTQGTIEAVEIEKNSLTISSGLPEQRKSVKIIFTPRSSASQQASPGFVRST
jgi:hypothetical protein